MKLNIMGLPYKVRWCREERDVDTEGKLNLSGQVSFTKNIISIHYGPDVSKEEMIDTFIHEIIHVIHFHLFRNHEPIADLCQMDAYVEPFVTTLLDTLNRNDLVKWKIPAPKA